MYSIPITAVYSANNLCSLVGCCEFVKSLMYSHFAHCKKCIVYLFTMNSVKLFTEYQNSSALYSWISLLTFVQFIVL